MMNSKHNVGVSMAILAMFSLFMFILFGDNGLADLKLMEKGRDSLALKNEQLIRKNFSIHRSIQRLKNDPVYIENVAREELGVIGRKEIIFKLARLNAGGLEQ